MMIQKDSVNEISEIRQDEWDKQSRTNIIIYFKKIDNRKRIQQCRVQGTVYLWIYKIRRWYK